MGRCVIDRPMNEVISFLEDHERRKEWDKYLAVCHIYVQVLCSYYNFPIQEIRILKRISNTDFICKFTESQEEINVSPNLINRLYASGSKTLLGETEKGYGCFCTKCQCCKLFYCIYRTIKCCCLYKQGEKHVRTTVSVDLPEYPPDPRITRADVCCTQFQNQASNNLIHRYVLELDLFVNRLRARQTKLFSHGVPMYVSGHVQ